MSRESLLSASALSEKPMPRERLVSCASALGDKGMMTTTTRKLQITAISAEGLLDGTKPLKKNAFVAFDIAGSYCNRSMTTRVDEVGGDYPVWEDKLETEFSSSEKTEESFMYVRVYSRIFGNDKPVGTARVPIKDFTGDYAPEGFLQCLSYRLWDDYGKRNGIINFSARIVPDNKAGDRPFWLR